MSIDQNELTPDNINQEIVKKTQKILKSQGYTVKLSHVYEMYSKLSGVKDWNSAKALKKNFKNVIVDTNKEAEFVASEILPFLKKPLLENEFFLGYKENGEANIVNMLQSPGIGMFGGMGSGKSQAAFTMLASKIISSSNNIVFIVDPIKGAMDYSLLFPFSRVIPLLNNDEMISPLIRLISDEIAARTQLFVKVGAKNIDEYEKKDKPLARIIVHFEEFQLIPNILKYHLKVDSPESTAYKLRNIIRIGRSYGIWISIVGVRATSDYFPSSLKAGITNIMAFRMNNQGDGASLNLNKASDIQVFEKGKCVTEEGFIQWNHLSSNEWKIYLDNVSKTEIPNTLTLSKKILNELKLGRFNYSINTELSIQDLLSELNYGDLGSSKVFYEKRIIPSFKLIFEKMGYEVSLFDGKYDIWFSLTKGSEKTLAMIKNKAGINSVKNIPILLKTMSNTNHSKGLVIIYDGIMVDPNHGRNEDLLWLDKEDLEYL